MINLTGNTKADSGRMKIPDNLIRSAIHRKYRLTSMLRKDFLGVLYKSAKRSGGRNLVVKVLDKEAYLAADVLGKVDHSRIAKIRDSITDKSGVQALVLEAPQGRCLTDIMSGGEELTEGESVSVALQLLSALHAVHWNSEVIGNLHSDSIYLSRDTHNNLELELINVGIGCRDDAVEQPYYQAPEQISGKTVDRHTDIWAVGVLFYEMLFGRRPFEGEKRYDIGGEILLKEPSYQGMWTNLPDDIVAVVKRALNKDPRVRYDNVTNMVSDLLPFQAEFKVSMSEAATAAVRESYPPPGIGKKPAAGKVSKPIQKLTNGLRSITPGVRSQAEARPADKKDAAAKADSGPKKFAMPLPAVKSKINKKTMLGMPAMINPERSLSRPAAASGSGSTGATASSPVAGSAESPSKVSPSGDPPEDDSSLGEEKTGALGSTAVPEILATVSVIASSWVRHKMALAIAASMVGAAVLVAVLLTTSGEGGAVDASPSGALTMPTKTSTKSGKAAKTETATPEPVAPKPAEQKNEEPSPPKEITVKVKGLPKNTIVKVGNKVVDTPIVLPYSKEPVAITFKKRGYKTVVHSLVPEENMIIEIKLDKEEEENKRSSRKRPKRGFGKTKSGGSDLADNPFGE
jgi:serine/threonine protein kinase